jgi:hypothetical protein
MNTEAPRIVAAVRARGSDAADVRDAAHEASHAIQHRLPSWHRNLIDLHMRRMRMRPRLLSEVRARAVEQLVCARLDVPYTAFEYCNVAVLEMFVTFDDVDKSLTTAAFMKMVAAESKSAATKRITEQLLRLGKP